MGLRNALAVWLHFERFIANFMSIPTPIYLL